MKTSIAIGAGCIALALAAGIGMPRAAFADDSTTRVNDSVIQTQQMDFYLRQGGYMLQQNTYAAAVGARNSTLITPVRWWPMPVIVQPVPVVATPVVATPYMAAASVRLPRAAAPYVAAPSVAVPYVRTLGLSTMP